MILIISWIAWKQLYAVGINDLIASYVIINENEKGLLFEELNCFCRCCGFCLLPFGHHDLCAQTSRSITEK